MTQFFKIIDTIIWGRKTYDLALSMGGLSVYGGKVRHYVFSRRPAAPAEGVTFINEPVEAFIKRLRAEPGKNIWIMGGAGVAASFLDAGAIDEFSIHVVPVLIGEGIPLVDPARRTVRLDLLHARSFPDGLVHMHYRVRGSA
jgi:dihydrofolate reductase